MAACNLEHTTDGCHGTGEEIALSFPTSYSLPETTGAVRTGDFGVELAVKEGDVAPVEIGDVEPAFGACVLVNWKDTGCSCIF